MKKKVWIPNMRIMLVFFWNYIVTLLCHIILLVFGEFKGCVCKCNRLLSVHKDNLMHQMMHLQIMNHYKCNVRSQVTQLAIDIQV